ncbi:MAG: hypothetical protein SOR72_04385 [Hornefia sp.]|nr:hypothetical protein [Hornefia sp.]
MKKIKILNKFLKKEEIADSFLDEKLFEYLQPQGGITFKEANTIFTGDGYIRVLHVHQLPKELNDFWLDNILNIDGTIATFDVYTRNVAEVKKNINKSLKEENSRLNTTTSYVERSDALKRRQDLEDILDELSHMGEVMKMIHYRIFVMGRNLIELDSKCENIMKHLESDNFLTSVLLNETKREWQSIFESYKTQHSKPFYMRALPLTTEPISCGYPFNYSELIDDYGTLLGFTPIGGAVIFNEFTKTKARKYYNSLVCGLSGSGKSTLLKKRFKAHACQGDFIRTFDPSGEFTRLTREFGGRIIKCNGTDGMLNPLEILKAGDDDSVSYTRHIAKVSSFFRCIMPNAKDELILTLESYLRDFYVKYDLVPQTEKSITGLASKEYPIFSDFYAFLLDIINRLEKTPYNNQVELKRITIELEDLLLITKAVKNIVQNYGHMFDGHTSIDNVVDEKIVTFDISDIKHLGNMFAAQMFLLVSLCWDNAISNGSIMKNLWDTGEIDIGEVTSFNIIIDEAHEWVNTSMPMILDLLSKYLREGRKYFAGITFASQSVRDFMPSIGSGKENLSDSEKKIITIFELTQYKFMFRQDNSATELLANIFGGDLTYSQIENIPILEEGENILAISGYKSFKFKVWLSEKYEEKLFAGGV